MTAAETYAALVDAANAQRVRLHGKEAPGARWDREVAQRFRYDPHRSLDASLDLIASYVEPQDVLIDVGGGAGRICLPMALRCREGIVVDVSQAIEMALQGRWLRPEDRERARGVIEAQCDELFSESPEGFRPLWHPATRELLITWEKDQTP